MCLRLCALGEECETGVPCEITPRSIVIAGVQYGVCPPPSAAPTGCPTP
jgi:hypothetical protein